MKYLPVLFSKAHENSTSQRQGTTGRQADGSDVRCNIDAPPDDAPCFEPTLVGTGRPGRAAIQTTPNAPRGSGRTVSILGRTALSLRFRRLGAAVVGNWSSSSLPFANGGH